MSHVEVKVYFLVAAGFFATLVVVAFFGATSLEVVASLGAATFFGAAFLAGAAAAIAGADDWESVTTVRGAIPQISLAYSRIVRSLENLPIRATFKMALRTHSS